MLAIPRQNTYLPRYKMTLRLDVYETYIINRSILVKFEILAEIPLMERAPEITTREINEAPRGFVFNILKHEQTG